MAANQPHANQPHANQPNANQPNANQPNANQRHPHQPPLDVPDHPQGDQPRAAVLSVNVGKARPTEHSTPGVTGIDKMPQAGSVELRRPAGDGDSGVAGDVICDVRHHGGPDQAVYAYAREDLDWWQARLGRDLRAGMFGENLTTLGVDINEALVGERWRIGDSLTLEVTTPRIPCRTFAGWLGEQGWVKTFTEQARSGTYLRVVEPGVVRAGDPIAVIARPAHDVTVRTTFRALTSEPEQLPRLAGVEALPDRIRARARRWIDSDARVR